MTDLLQKVIDKTHKDMKISRKKLKNSIKATSKFDNYKKKTKQKRDSKNGFICHRCKGKFYTKYIIWWWINTKIGVCSNCYNILESNYLEKNLVK